MRIIQIQVSDNVYSQLARKARDIGRGTKPEDVAEDWLGQRARETTELAQRFVEAGKTVDRELGLAKVKA